MYILVVALVQVNSQCDTIGTHYWCREEMEFNVSLCCTESCIMILKGY